MAVRVALVVAPSAVLLVVAPAAPTTAVACALSRRLLTRLGLEPTPTMFSTTAAAAAATAQPCLLLVPGAGFADTMAEFSPEEQVPSGLWSTLQFATSHGLVRGSMVRYVLWVCVCVRVPACVWACGPHVCHIAIVPHPLSQAIRHGVRPVVLRSRSDECVAAALDELASAPPPARLLVAAHSEGGASVVRVLVGGQPSLRACIVGMVLLDSVHAARDLAGAGLAAEEARQFLLSEAVVHYVSSPQPLGHAKPKPWVKAGASGGVKVRSAGTSYHLSVPAAACDAACAFFERRLSG